MTTRPQPNNATPQRLNLAAQIVPRMPFSSPMGEEVLSPTSPNASRSPPQHQIQLSQNQPKLQNSLDERGKLASKRLESEESSPSQVPNKPRWQGLNVITNLSKPPSLAQMTVDGNARQNAGLGLKQKEGSSVPTSGNASVEKLGHQPSGKSLRSLGSKGRLGDLKRASSKWSNLSPSDRAVVIGISVSPEELAQQSACSDASPARLEGLTEQHAIDQQASDAPAIVVTPAKETAPWSAESGDSFQHQRPRAASSVYSQVPASNGNRVVDSSVVPPIPPLPPDARKHNALNRISQKIRKGPPPRITSTYTDIDDGESPEIFEEDRPGTGESQLRILTKSSSLDTIATRHRSRGWWNEIISPFFPRSPMNFKPSSPLKQTFEEKQMPVKKDTSLQEARQTFPQPPAFDDIKSAHTSWTDSSIDADCEKHVEDIEPRDRGTVIFDEPQEDLVRDSLLIPSKFEGFGQAAEYYEACLYDMHSSTPYFECQNHACFPPTSSSVKTSLGDSKVLRGAESTEAPVPLQRLRETEKAQISAVPHAVQQAPTNRFSAAFHEAIGEVPKRRPKSDATVIEDIDTTPDVQEARAAPVVRAPVPVPALQPAIPENKVPSEPVSQPSRESQQSLPPPEPAFRQKSKPYIAYSPPESERQPKRYVAVMPPNGGSRPVYEQPLSPEPLSPGQQQRASRGAIPLKDAGQITKETQAPNDSTKFVYRRKDPQPEHTTVADLYPPPKEVVKHPRTLEINEKNTLPPRETKLHRPLTLPRCRNCFSNSKPISKKKKWILIAVMSGLVLLIIMVLVLTMTLTKKGAKRPIQSSWLNIAGFPPIPTGVSTIIQPNAVKVDSDCVQPPTMWSCALPKEEQPGISPNAPDQPNFRVEIIFQNGTNATSNATNNASTNNINTRSYGHVVNAVSAGSFIKNHLLRARDAFSGSAFTPSPAPPSREDQMFLGNTTDELAAPFEGEFTPFFMSFQFANKLSSRLAKRQNRDSANASDQFPDSTKAIPPPDSNPDGTAAAANLYPLPSSQPLRLYDRDKDTEHYGFYTYFERSIFLKSNAPIDSSSDNTTPVPDDQAGGSDRDAAAVRCTWAQTRFLVQIWTKKGNSASLLNQDATNSTSNPTQPSKDNATSLTSSSANDFTQPGSFPYPITITLDRHGGDIAKKMIYCYGMDERQHINATEKQFQLEDRGVGGQLVNPALGPFGDVNVTTEEGGPGGIDGGSGGCMCKWQNFDTGV